MSLKKIIKKIFYTLKPSSIQFENVELCGVPLKLTKGTARKEEDQDDAWWFHLSRHHNAIFDIGCNVGYTALLALIQNPNRQIILVDPNPEALKLASMNIIQNGLGNRAMYLSAFVSDKLDDTVKFYTVGSGQAGSMYASHATTASSMNSFLDVKTVTLDYMYDYYQIKPDIVKIDVEGAETLVMKSAVKLAKETLCSFFVEMHNVEGLGMEAAGSMMISWCQENNYRAWYLKTGEQLTTAETIASRGKCHLLLLPKDQDYPEYLKEVPQKGKLPNSI